MLSLVKAKLAAGGTWCVCAPGVAPLLVSSELRAYGENTLRARSGGIFRNSPSSRFPSGPFQQDWPHPSPGGSPRGPPAPSLPHGVGLQVLLPSVFWGQIPAFLAWERAGKQPQALSSKEGFLLGCIFPSSSWDFSLFPLCPSLAGAEGTLPPRCSHRHPHDVRASFPSSHPSRGDLAGWGLEAELAPGLQVGQIPPGAGFGRCPGPPSIRGPGTPCKTSPEPPSSFRGPFSPSIWGQDPSPGTSCPPWGKG